MLVNPTLQLLVGVFCMGEQFTASHAHFVRFCVDRPDLVYGG